MNYEDVLEAKIFPELEAGRPNWDKPHTEAVVEHIKAIIENSPQLDLDKDVLIIAAHAHDWGYSGLFKEGKLLSLNDVNSAKQAHMRIGANKLSKLLQASVFNFLSEERKKRAVHLVQVHDKLDELTDPDEIVLMEADTLGGLDIEKVKPSFDKASNERYMRGVRKMRYPMFMTAHGKKQFEKLYRSREEYYAK